MVKVVRNFIVLRIRNYSFQQFGGQTLLESFFWDIFLSPSTSSVLLPARVLDRGVPYLAEVSRANCASVFLGALGSLSLRQSKCFNYKPHGLIVCSFPFQTTKYVGVVRSRDVSPSQTAYEGIPTSYEVQCTTYTNSTLHRCLSLPPPHPATPRTHQYHVCTTRQCSHRARPIPWKILLYVRESQAFERAPPRP